MAFHVTTVKIGKQGRLVVPAPLRQELGLEAGDELVARAFGERLIFERRAAVVERLRARFKNVKGSMTEELLTERREEAAREWGKRTG
jgi:AbrB family looped-hinge helix DNA binding protein